MNGNLVITGNNKINKYYADFDEGRCLGSRDKATGRVICFYCDQGIMTEEQAEEYFQAVANKLYEEAN